MSQYLQEFEPALQAGALIKAANIESSAVTTAKINALAVTGAKLSTGTGYFTVAADTNGTTAVSVFGASGLSVAVTITGVFLVSQDTTAGNITVENPASTVVCTIAKGTASGALVGATTLANTTVAAGTNLVVDSSSAGNARVFITFTVS